tara:strand:- start:496 stop:744 length:249 start_codon:yes stop_codon:yes gene_type:complete
MEKEIFFIFKRPIRIYHGCERNWLKIEYYAEKKSYGLMTYNELLVITDEYFDAFGRKHSSFSFLELCISKKWIKCQENNFKR